MHTGMIYFDNDAKKTLQQKVQGAADYYAKKYGRAPDLCLVHPSMFSNQEKLEIEGMNVRGYRPVLPGHLWIGIDDKS